MVFTKDGLIRLLITVVISVVIYTSAGVIFFDGFVNYGLLIKSIVLGSIIWFAAEIGFDIADKLCPHNILPSYILLCVIIALGTTTGLLIFGIKSFRIILLIDIISIFCGLAIAVVNRRRYKNKLNKQLKEFKESDKETAEK